MIAQFPLLSRQSTRHCSCTSTMIASASSSGMPVRKLFRQNKRTQSTSGPDNGVKRGVREMCSTLNSCSSSSCNEQTLAN